MTERELVGVVTAAALLCYLLPAAVRLPVAAVVWLRRLGVAIIAGGMLFGLARLVMG